MIVFEHPNLEGGVALIYNTQSDTDSTALTVWHEYDYYPYGHFEDVGYAGTGASSFIVIGRRWGTKSTGIVIPHHEDQEFLVKYSSSSGSWKECFLVRNKKLSVIWILNGHNSSKWSLEEC